MPELISASTLAQLQRIALSAMQDTCTIIRPTETDDGGGSTVPGEPVSIETRCNFQPVRDLPRAEQATAEEYGRYRLAVPIETTVLTTDQIRYRDRLYRVVWAPPIDALAVERAIGLVEA